MGSRLPQPPPKFSQHHFSNLRLKKARGAVSIPASRGEFNRALSGWAQNSNRGGCYYCPNRTIRLLQEEEEETEEKKEEEEKEEKEEGLSTCSCKSWGNGEEAPAQVRYLNVEGWGLRRAATCKKNNKRTDSPNHKDDDARGSDRSRV